MCSRIPTWTLIGAPNSTFTIQFFGSSPQDPTGVGEGGIYLGQATAVTGPDGVAFYSANVPTLLKSGQFVTASLQSVTAAAAGVAMPDDFRVSITNADGKDAYPIASFTWLLLYQNPTDKERARVMVDFLKWAITDGQKFAPDLGYAQLPQPVVEKEMAALGRLSS